MSVELLLNSASRVMLFAPHPDDEALGFAGLLQRAASAGAGVRVIFATRGENNSWTQRVVERRVRIGAADRARFGERRRLEAIASLRCLGVEADHTIFLGYPDQSITPLLLSGNEMPVTRISREMAAWAPGILVLPALGDLHPDHSALAILARLAQDRLDPAQRPGMVLSYVIHGAFGGMEPSVCLTLSNEERDLKREAIRCHRTQLAVHPRQFMSFAGPREVFSVEASPMGEAGGRQLDTGGNLNGVLRLQLPARSRFGALRQPTLSLLVVTSTGERDAYAVSLRRRAGPSRIRRLSDGAPVGIATIHAHRGWLTVALTLPMRWRAARLFFKISRRFAFFDDVGWTEVSAFVSRQLPALPRLVGSMRTGPSLPRRKTSPLEVP